jgi:hypothetical protein
MNHPLANIFGALLVTAMVAALPVVIVWLVLRHRRAIAQMRQAALLAIIERGSEVPPDLLADGKGRSSDEDLRRGLFLLLGGAGIVACLLVLPDRRFWGIGLVPVFAGAGYLLTWLIVRARRRHGGG